MKITIHQTAKVAGGYEYFYSVFDDDGDVILGNQFHFCGEKKPDEKPASIEKDENQDTKKKVK